MVTKGRSGAGRVHPHPEVEPEHVRIVDELPVTVTGKPQTFVMRDRMVENGYADAAPAGGPA